MYLCIIDYDSQVKLQRNIDADPDAFLDAIAPYAGQVIASAGSSRVACTGWFGCYLLLYSLVYSSCVHFRMTITVLFLLVIHRVFLLFRRDISRTARAPVRESSLAAATANRQTASSHNLQTPA